VISTTAFDCEEGFWRSVEEIIRGDISLVDRIGSGVRISASFKNAPPRGSVMARSTHVVTLQHLAVLLRPLFLASS